jgi:hypothetical protein
MVEQLLAPLQPSEGALTPLFQTEINANMLREIAEADYGWKGDECYALLQPILKTGQVASNDVNLREVLELIRWSEPDDPAWSPGGHGRRGHWMRLFACTVLVRLAPKCPASFDSECDTLAQLNSSAIELGRSAAQAAASVLAWRFLAYPPETEDRAFLAFAILLLATHLERGNDRGRWLKDIATWVEDEESKARNATFTQRSSLPNWGEWLMGLTFFHARETVWRSLARRILARPESPHPGEADEALRLLGERMCCKNDSAGDRPIPLLAGMDCSAFQSEGFLDELNLPKDIPFGQPPHLAFPDHVQNLVALNRPPRSIERSKTLAGIHPPLDRSMVLFHNIV